MLGLGLGLGLALGFGLGLRYYWARLMMDVGPNTVGCNVWRGESQVGLGLEVAMYGVVNSNPNPNPTLILIQP
jgi:hypothetical protein